MNEINLVEILKDAPIGTKLWSPLCGECTLTSIDTASTAKIIVNVDDDITLSFDANGLYFRYEGAECLLFPSKENRDWSTFKTSCEAPWKHKHFEPFEKVLIPSRGYDISVWMADIYSHYKYGEHYTIKGIRYSDNEILPYEGNEDKVGKPVE